MRFHGRRNHKPSQRNKQPLCGESARLGDRLFQRDAPVKEGTLVLGELTDTFRFQEDLPNGPHEPLPMWLPQENEPQ